MDFVLCGLSYMTCLVYLNNIIIFGRSFDEQLARLREVFNRIRSANLKLKRTSALSFDGAFLSLATLCPSTASQCNGRRSEQYGIGRPCETPTEIRAFLGTCGYYRRFVKDYSMIAAPLNALTRRKPRMNGQLSVNEHLKFSSSGSCTNPFLLCLWTQGPIISTVMRATTTREPYSPRSNPESRS